MTQMASIALTNGDLLGGVKEFFRSILALEEIGALLVPQRLPMKNRVMPTLVTDPDRLDGVDPLAPAYPMNTAKMVSRLTRKPMGQKIAVVLRPCEIRALVELVKLHQANTDELVILGIDCLGAFPNTDYFEWAGTDGEASTRRFYRQILLGENGGQSPVGLSQACTVCELPIPEGADLLLGLYGVDSFLKSSPSFHCL
jgi:formate dehydrogenase subunit beta